MKEQRGNCFINLFSRMKVKRERNPREKKD